MQLHLLAPQTVTALCQQTIIVLIRAHRGLPSSRQNRSKWSLEQCGVHITKTSTLDLPEVAASFWPNRTPCVCNYYSTPGKGGFSNSHTKQQDYSFDSTFAIYEHIGIWCSVCCYYYGVLLQTVSEYEALYSCTGKSVYTVQTCIINSDSELHYNWSGQQMDY
jgi:hypothetical protein